MYICLDCGATFDEPVHIKDNHGMEGPYYESFTQCPKCGEGDIEEATFCDQCDTMIPVSYIKDRFGLCEACELGALNQFKDYMNTSFTPKERRYLNWIFDGSDF